MGDLQNTLCCCKVTGFENKQYYRCVIFHLDHFTSGKSSLDLLGYSPALKQPYQNWAFPPQDIKYCLPLLKDISYGFLSEKSYFFTEVFSTTTPVSVLVIPEY